MLDPTKREALSITNALVTLESDAAAIRRLTTIDDLLDLDERADRIRMLRELRVSIRDVMARIHALPAGD